MVLEVPGLAFGLGALAFEETSPEAAGAYLEEIVDAIVD